MADEDVRSKPKRGGPLPGAPGSPRPAVPRAASPVLANPILYIDTQWNSQEKNQIFDDLKKISKDTLVLRGDGVYIESFSSQGGVGTTLLRSVQNPEGKTVIKPSTTFFPTISYEGKDISVNLNLKKYLFFTRNVSSQQFGPFGTTVQEAPTFIVLAHELVHAYRKLRTGVGQGVLENHFFDESGLEYRQNVLIEELNTCGIMRHPPISENMVRRENGLNLRHAYASPSEALDQQGVTPVGIDPPWWPNYPKK
jgi:hypothetical protein